MHVRFAPRNLWSLTFGVLTIAACEGSPATAADTGVVPDDDASVVTGSGDGGVASADDAAPDSPPVSCTPATPQADAPVIFQAPSPVAPGQVALLFGARVGAGARVRGMRLPDDDPGLPPRPADCVPESATDLDVVQTSTLAAAAVVPSAWSDGLFVLVVTNASGAGAPVVLNRPRVDWVRGGPRGALVAGASFDAYGRSFGASPRAWLVDGKGNATALGAGTKAGAASTDGYAASFSVPAIAPGAYSLYVHSGKGGRAGFSDPLDVSVVAASPWPSTVYPVAPSANHDATLAAALASAKAAGGGVIAFAKGSYTLTHGVLLPPKTVLTSASGNRADVTVTFDEPAIPFPYGFAGDADFTVSSITVKSSSSARLFQCPSGANYLRDPRTGAPQYQPDAPCQNAKLHDVDFTLTTLRDLVSNGVQTTTPTGTIMIVMNGDDCEISDSTLTNRGGGVLSSSKAHRLWLLRNTMVSGTTRVKPSEAMPYTDATSSVGGGNGLYTMRDVAIVGNTITNASDLGASATMFIEYTAHDLYIADNTIGPNLSNYGEGFSFDAPYYPSFVGLPTSLQGRRLVFPRVLNAVGKTVFDGPDDGAWPANDGTGPLIGGTTSLVGESVVVVGGTGLGQYAEVASNEATAKDGATALTLDRDFAVPLDATSVVEVATNKSKIVFARNTFHDVAVGAQLCAGGFDFLVDGTKGETMEGTYCYAYDAMTSRNGNKDDRQRRFARCYFNQWIDTALTTKVDPSYPWAMNPRGGVSTPYTTNGLVGVHVGVGQDPLLPAQRGIGAVGNVVRGNHTDGFTYGFAHSNVGPMPSPTPTFGRDNLLEDNAAATVPVGTFVDTSFPHTFERGGTCPGCKTNVENNGDMP